MQNFIRPNRSERKAAIFKKLYWRRRIDQCPSESIASPVPGKVTFVYADSPVIYYYTSGSLREERIPTRCNNIYDLLSIPDVDY